MQSTTGRLLFSPSDLNHFLECEHLIQLELAGGDAPPPARDLHAELLAAKGLEHERAWLQRFRDQGLRIVEIESERERDWHRDAERTIAAMRDGVDVVYQGVFVDEGWRGISDFLVRTDADVPAGDLLHGRSGGSSGPPTCARSGGPSGPPLYEAWDTKLARQSKPYFLLQLCFYSEQIGRILGRDPEQMHIILGTGEADRFRYADFAAYYRAVRRRFLLATQSGLRTYPYPVSHCRLCHYQRDCNDRWHADDHLSQVAGITREQVQRLNDAGIHTVAQLAENPGSQFPPDPRSLIPDPRSLIPDPRSPTPRLRIGDATIARLRHQARLQAGHRKSGTHRYELLPADERSGFRLLPHPSPGDIFFDMEGDPYFEPARGLEYLFGAVTVDRGFTSFLALTREDEKAAFERFIDWVQARLTQWPDLHVYHYAAYEITALKRLMSEHATREDELDDLLRREVFVDLYQVVRQSLRVSHASYSIKKVRTFFMENAGAGAVADGGDSILQFERFRVTGDRSILQAIVDYNREDCVSTLELRDWLLERRQDAERAAGTAIAWKTVDPPTENPKRIEEDTQTAQRVGALRALDPTDDARRPGPAVWTRRTCELLAHLLGYHRREAKPEWWAYFDRQKKSLDQLLDDTQAIAWLDEVGDGPVVDKQSFVYTLGFPDQEFKLAAESSIINPFTGKAPGTLDWVDASTLRLGLKRGRKRSEPLPAAICAGAPLDDSVQRSALGRLADAVIADAADVGRGLPFGPAKYAAALALLARALPRLTGYPAGASLQTLDLDAQKALVASLDHSYLFIQGPPGSGKTWTGARLIVSLIERGKRVGVAANSHKAINNLLAEVERVAAREGVTFVGLKKGGGGDAFGGGVIRDVEKNEEIEAACVAAAAGQSGVLVAGTAWLFSREKMDQSLDYLFIDEAGQVSLADAVAMGTAARNLVLLGDPQQLPQVRQGIHPGESGCSVLEHLLNAGVADVGAAFRRPNATNVTTAPHATVAEDRGIFLAQTWRMHPDICRFVSELSYDGRLLSAAGRDRQRVDSRGLSGSGLRYIPVEHTGNSQQSPEEADAIAAEIGTLLAGGTFADHEGRTRPLTTADVLVVAPFNMQVRCIRETLRRAGMDGVEVGTVDKFQGREAPVVFFSMASSTGEDVPRGLEFLFNRNRFNVAISRARALAVVVSSPRLMDVKCRSIEQMRLANMLCRYVEYAESTP